MLSDLTIALIGPGVMAEAMLKGLLKQQLTSPQRILVAGPNAERNQELQTTYGVQPFTDNRAAAAQADIVVLSIKPQRMEKVVSELKGALKPDAFILSIIAGASIKKIARLSGHERIVRCMPNTPAQIGEGITVWTASPQVSQAQQEMTCAFLNAFGKEIFVEEEDYLDKATALSGTGPAYVYLFMEAMVDAGVHLGFPRRIAERLVVETLRGSVDYYDNGKGDARHLANLRNQVTSPGGTSAEALYYLEKAGFRTAISRAIWAAYQRSRELGRDAETNPPEE
ncbi:MAG TPA: pyrroline-5-carboxylate reductase [Anaerolineaceae bacterium]|nr:pyrroline-5-carboxylate reductase [Anaerolineaceae bacterium]